MSFVAIGTNHKSSPIELRERITFPKSRLKDALFMLGEISPLRAAVILSTCNRTEIYASTYLDGNTAFEEIENFITRYHEVEKERLSPYMYRYSGQEAIRHLFFVASGLDSLILGETQIAAQVKNIMEHPEKVRAVIETAKAMVMEKYDWDLVAKDMREKVFKPLLARG